MSLNAHLEGGKVIHSTQLMLQGPSHDLSDNNTAAVVRSVLVTAPPLRRALRSTPSLLRRLAPLMRRLTASLLLWLGPSRRPAPPLRRPAPPLRRPAPPLRRPAPPLRRRVDVASGRFASEHVARHRPAGPRPGPSLLMFMYMKIVFSPSRSPDPSSPPRFPSVRRSAQLGPCAGPRPQRRPGLRSPPSEGGATNASARA